MIRPEGAPLDAARSPAPRRPVAGLNALAASLAVAWILTALFAGLGPVAWVALSGRVADAGLYFAVFALAAALGAAAGGRAMEAFGRVRTLVAAHLLNAVGYALCAFGVLRGGLVPFVAGVALSSAGAGTVGLTRLVAAELAPVAERGRAVGRLLAAPLLGAYVALASVAIARAFGAPVTATGYVWLLAPPVALVAAFLVARAPEPLREDAAVAWGGVARPRDVVVAFVTLALAHSAMVAVMGVAGVAIGHAGHGPLAVSFVLALHFTGMFAPSPIVGRVVDRLGARPTAMGGLVLLAVGGVVVATVPGVVGFAGGLLVIGAGWSFAYLSATVLLAGAVSAERRARTTGLADLVTSLVAAGVTAGAGAWYAGHGVLGLGFAAALIALLPGIAFAAARPKAA